MDKRVQAIRSHPTVGKGSCSPIDECYSDEELLVAIKGKTLPQALDWALGVHSVWADRWGFHEEEAKW